VKVLITSSRMPFALGMVRKLAAEGREIYAADDHLLSPGNHSKYLAGHFVYPSPRSDTAGFLAELERIAQEHEIDVIVPAFEEVFAQQRGANAERARQQQEAERRQREQEAAIRAQQNRTHQRF
jgi:hypothetical protein